MAPDPVAAKKTCPKFEAGFLHVETVDDFNNVNATEDAIKNLNELTQDELDNLNLDDDRELNQKELEALKKRVGRKPTQKQIEAEKKAINDKEREEKKRTAIENKSIFTHLPDPHKILQEPAFQYVNFENKEEGFRDNIPGIDPPTKFHADRMGINPRIVVRFTEKKVFSFKLEIIADTTRVIPTYLEYYDTEKAKANNNFKQKLKLEPADPDYQTNADGFLIIPDLSLGAAAGNFYIKLKVTVTEDFDGDLEKEFDQGVLTTARYIWMLPVIVGTDRWVPAKTHIDCMEQTIAMYKDEAFIHINNKNLAKEINSPSLSTELNIDENEFIDFDEMLANYEVPVNSIVEQFKVYLNRVNRLPKAIKKYTFVALMVRLFYTKKVNIKVKDAIPLDGKKHIINVTGEAVIPFKPGTKPYLISAVGTYKNWFTLGITKKTIDISHCTRAVNGYDKDNNRTLNGHVGCTAFEVDTALLPQKAIVNLHVDITYYGMKKYDTLGFQISPGGNPTGFLVFTTQSWNNAAKTLIVRNDNEITVIASHELGHAVQMAAGGSPTGPNKIPHYYDSFGRNPGPAGTANHSGPHCSVGHPHVTCLMYGGVAGNTQFCTTPVTNLATLEANKENDCTKAVRKVDLNEPFIPHR